ncbi:MAG: histidine ammonia-lyase [Bacteroidota bacterium]
MKTHIISSEKIDLSLIKDLLDAPYELQLSEDSINRIVKCRDYLDKRIASGNESIYGVNTGFGSLYNKSISLEDLDTLQDNLVMSHACGTGDEVPKDIVKLMLFLKIQGLSYGNSGIQLAVVERLIYFFNNDILPVVYQQGSLGASGDLAPLAHLSLPLIGMGEVYHKGVKKQTNEVLKVLNLNPIKLKAKDGLALLNGTQFMAAYGCYCLINSNRLFDFSTLIAAMSIDAFDGRIEPFHANIQNIRPHTGQKITAEYICEILEDSEIIKQQKAHVQDPYSFRCIPQVHGASIDAIEYVASVFLTEINSVTDNPTIFPDDDLVISAGNFHGQPLALALDFLAIALSELGNISERRTYQLISGQRGLPPFLVANPGLNSGLMIPQYTAASIVSQNKQLCSPASVDSIVSSNGQEDHVSMGANAATKAFKVVENLEKILAIELLTAAQALEFRRPLRSSSIIESMIENYRKTVPFISQDRVLYDDIRKSIEFIKNINGIIE